jgi:hypothetical protein
MQTFTEELTSTLRAYSAMTKYPTTNMPEYGIAKGSSYPLVRYVNVNIAPIIAESADPYQFGDAMQRISQNVRGILPGLCAIYYTTKPTTAADDFDGDYTELIAELNDWVAYAVRMMD